MKKISSLTESLERLSTTDFDQDTRKQQILYPVYSAHIILFSNKNGSQTQKSQFCATKSDTDVQKFENNYYIIILIKLN